MGSLTETLTHALTLTLTLTLPLTLTLTLTLTLSSLKELIGRAGLGLHGCIEKADLRQRAREAQAKLATQAQAALTLS